MKARNTVHKLILQAFLVIICWKIWKSWVACKYGDNNSFYLYRMVTQYVWNIKVVLHDAFSTIDTSRIWGNLCTLVENLELAIVCTLIHWTKLTLGRIKINRDGSFIKANMKGGIDGFVRDSNGSFIFAFSIPIQANNISQA